MAQADLNRAKETKYDEYYTRLEDIENELRHYKNHFKGKTILCNCDDPYESNFFKYFAMNFNHLGLKKLITTCYATSPVVYTQLALFEDMEQTVVDKKKKPYKVEITEVGDENADGAFDLEDIKHLLKNKNNTCKVLKGDGDFRSDECISLLKEADIVVTNPPFSLFREYVAQLMEYKKQFLIIGNQNALHYKEIFPLIQNNQVWTGYKRSSGGGWYLVTKEFETDVKNNKKKATWKEVNGVFLVNCPMLWFTNLDIEKRHEELIMYKTYNPEEYPHYYNYDAIDVGSIAAIPSDYYGNMGVPDGFLEIYNPEQFEIVGLGRDGEGITVDRSIYPEIKKLNPNSRPSHLGYYQNGIPKEPYSRIIIRRKDQPT